MQGNVLSKTCCCSCTVSLYLTEKVKQQTDWPGAQYIFGPLVVYAFMYVMCLCLIFFLCLVDSFLCACVICLFLCLCFLKFTIPSNSPYHVFGNRTRDLPNSRMLYHLGRDQAENDGIIFRNRLVSLPRN